MFIRRVIARGSVDKILLMINHRIYLYSSLAIIKCPGVYRYDVFGEYSLCYFSVGIPFTIDQK